MNTPQKTDHDQRDPLGLRGLPTMEPDRDGWPVIRQALVQQQSRRKRWKVSSAWLAAAASIVFAVIVTTRQMSPGPEILPPVEQATEMAATQDEQHVDSLIALSQTLETQLRNLRENTGSMPANSAIYVAELEDLVAQVDNELSYSPDSVNLWGQRVNLLLDLAQIYQHQWETTYGQMASL